MKLIKLFLLLAFVGFALNSCSSVSVTTDFDPDVDFTKYKTYKFYEGKPITGDALNKNPLIKKRIVASIKAELEAKGFKYDQANGQLIVVTHAGVKEKVRVSASGGAYYGWYDPWWGPAYSSRYVDVDYYDEATLVIDFVRDDDKELAWRGMGTSTLRGYSDPEAMQAKIDNVVNQILMRFPPM
jgi:Domain of unknown function (DUF4136)